MWRQRGRVPGVRQDGKTLGVCANLTIAGEFSPAKGSYVVLYALLAQSTAVSPADAIIMAIGGPLILLGVIVLVVYLATR